MDQVLQQLLKVIREEIAGGDKIIVAFDLNKNLATVTYQTRIIPNPTR